MIESSVTLIGNVMETPEPRVTASGLLVTSFKIACTSRRFDRSQGRWVDGPSQFLTVSCWRQLADNVVASLRRGDRVIVIGRLRQRQFSSDSGARRVVVEVEADVIGPDLSRAPAAVRRPFTEARTPAAGGAVHGPDAVAPAHVVPGGVALPDVVASSVATPFATVPPQPGGQEDVTGDVGEPVTVGATP